MIKYIIDNKNLLFFHSFFVSRGAPDGKKYFFSKINYFILANVFHIVEKIVSLHR